MLHQHVVEAQRIGGVGGVAALGTEDGAVLVELDAPDRAACGVADEQVAVGVNARPFVTIACGFALPVVNTVRPIPWSFSIAGTRNASTPGPPPGGTSQTVPTALLPSDAHKLPSSSNAIPFACGTCVAYGVPVGGAAASGTSRTIVSFALPTPVT